ncbi:MAG: A/G-specific adenine glycosylase [Gammaproteobacteria bacterium]|jgi:A/G-specific adenine glycosylase
MRHDAILSGPLLRWYDQFGRHDLPWKQHPSAYRVWVSEVMLQQTQVTTVIPYFERFMARFPEITALADAEIDDVLHLWAGLGYYARGRNLHRAARSIRDEHAGTFPTDIDTVMALSGIGRSTAGAILALSQHQRHPILDGNVKRVLARYRGVEGWPGRPGVERILWQHAEHHTPTERVSDYTQAVMDLGATMCTRARPRCALCPLNAECVAYRTGQTADLPTRKPKKTLPQRNTLFIIARTNDGEVLLERRPPSGIWGGLWSFPEAEDDDALRAWCTQHLGVTGANVRTLPTIHHGFSHYKLDIHPRVVSVPAVPPVLMEGGHRLWYKAGHSPALGLAAPVTQLLARLAEQLAEQLSSDEPDMEY